ncbi:MULTISPECIES: aconitase family protein [Streptomyces]|uniref:aconitase family protein n=1 Tax=Streptomyces TaxID=1883 RepID=UPI0029A04E37|nr:aconitase family protein [Streptomyces scabiei]MDX3116462.1 aconitase family protein [Streptomyces scabiei]
MQRPADTAGHGPDRTIKLRGNVLVLTEDPALLAAQLDGDSALTPEQLLREPLRNNISTDEIIPGWCCYWYDEKLGDYAYLGLRERQFGEGAVKAYAPQIIVSGEAKGSGSSREHAVYAEKYSGTELVFARSFERIYQQNCRNVGIVTCDDFEVLAALLAGEELPLEAFTRKANDIERAIIDLGGLFGFNREQSDGTRSAIRPAFAGSGPLNIVEKIIQSRLSPRNPLPEDARVRVGESYFVRADVRFSHEYVTPMAAGMFTQQFGEDATLADPDSCYFFQDHLSLAEQVLTRRPRGPELIERVHNLGRRQQEFAALGGGHFIGPSDTGGSRAICHNYIVEHVARPGDVIIGTDSHTCTAGAVGALAFGVGATDIANAWYNREILVKVPAVIRINLLGRLPQGVCAKDLMLTLLAHPMIEGSQTLGKVLLFTGPGCAPLNMDERATLCNMAVEAGGMTALFEPDDVTHAHLAGRPGTDAEADAGADAGSASLTSDADAVYSTVVDIALDDVEPMVALPGDPRNAVPLASVHDAVKVDKVYGGSCTGGKAYDMDMYASVFELARSRGMSVPEGVQAYLQVGSETVMKYAVERGYVTLFEDVGVQVLPPSCGACINAGPGVSESPSEVTVSAQNRNFPGRSGPGQVYLASPYVVAATAIAGRLSSVEAMLEAPADPASAPLPASSEARP